MKPKLALGSLFDGIGGFPLAAVRSGIVPIWAAEIEPFCIAVTRERFPDMLHLGSVTEIHGADIPPVDIITFGSPCQDLSVAGKRAGLNGERSGLFRDAVRIIYEMREATNGVYPNYIVWENVPGAFSSHGGNDFKAVLEEITKADIPMPASRKWANAGMVRGSGICAAWRVLDAKYWGVAQRRKRIYLVGSFGSDAAGEILFKCDSMQGDSAPCGKTGQEATSDVRGSINGSDRACRIYNARGEGGGEVAPAIVGGHNSGVNDNAAVVVYETEGIACGFSYKAGEKAGSVVFEENNAPTLSATRHDASVLCLQGNTIDRKPQNGGNGSGINVNICHTLNTIDRHAVVYNNNCYGVDCRNMAVNAELYPTLQAKPNGGMSLNYSGVLLYKKKQWSARRLTPLECERLQGYQDYWTRLQKKERLDGTEFDFWRDVMITDKRIRGKKYNPCITPEKLLRWYNGLECDGSKYKAIGNSLAIPCAMRVVGGIADYEEKKVTK